MNLSPETYSASKFDGTIIERNESYLSSVQRKKIFEAMLNARDLSYSDLALFDIAMGIDDNVLLNKLKSTIETVNPEDPKFTIALMERIVKLSGDIDLENLYSNYLQTLRGSQKLPSDRQKLILWEFNRKMERVEVKRVVWGWGEGLV